MVSVILLPASIRGKVGKVEKFLIHRNPSFLGVGGDMIA
jgi:hypothetical protein